MNIKNQSFTLSLEDAFFEKQQKRVQIDPSPSPPHLTPLPGCFKVMVIY